MVRSGFLGRLFRRIASAAGRWPHQHDVQVQQAARDAGDDQGGVGVAAHGELDHPVGDDGGAAAQVQAARQEGAVVVQRLQRGGAQPLGHAGPAAAAAAAAARRLHRVAVQPQREDLLQTQQRRHVGLVPQPGLELLEGQAPRLGGVVVAEHAVHEGAHRLVARLQLLRVQRVHDDLF